MVLRHPAAPSDPLRCDVELQYDRLAVVPDASAGVCNGLGGIGYWRGGDGGAGGVGCKVETVGE